MSGTRIALLIGCSHHGDPEFQRLTAPAQDIDALRRVLVDPEIGYFTVDTLLDEPLGTANVKIDDFFGDRRPDDLLLLYFSCHGVLDAKGRLYFVAADTKKDLLSSTGISAQWVKQQMDQSRAQRIVLLLDCCYSGAFTTKGREPYNADAREILERQLGGRGRVVITASDKMELSYESEFTDALVRGLETGAADLDGDGQVEVGELYRYVHDQVRQNTSGQTPTMSADGIHGQLYLARNPHAPLPLPEELRQALESKIVWKRRWAVNGLLLLLTGDHPGGLKITARKALIRLRDHDINESVQAAVEEALNEVSQRPDFTGGRHQSGRRSAKYLVAAMSGVLILLVSLLVAVIAENSIPCTPITKPADGSLSFGTLIPITGSASYRSQALDASVKLAMDEISAAEGIPGVGVKLDKINQLDEGDPSTNDASRSVDALLSNGVDAIIGPVTSAAAVKVIDKVTCAGVIMFSPANSANLFTTYGDHGLYFRTAPTSVIEGSVLGKLIVDDGNSGVVIMSRDDAYGNSLREVTGEVIEKAKGKAKVVDSFSFDPDASDYGNEIQRLKDVNPDAIVLIGFTESARILSSMVKEGLGPLNKHVYGSNANMNNTLASQVIPQNLGILEGMKGPLVNIGDEGFIKRLRTGNPPILDLAYSAQAYDAVVVTALAAAVAHTDQSAAVAKEINGVTKGGQKCTAFKECMTLVGQGRDIDYDGPSGSLDFTDAGEPCSATYVIREFQKDGTVKPLRSELVNRCP
jgi:ABC-type branched-subunit amino acid transport system substrate-binding protein